MPTLLYKGAIRDLRGDDLLPLNLIRDRYPDLYEREVVKYAERPHVMDHPVYPLDCGLTYWTIDANLLSPDRTCILLKRHDPLFQPQAAEDYIPYTPPKQQPRCPLRPIKPWADIPHILHRGPIPVSAFRDPAGNPIPS